MPDVYRDGSTDGTYDATLTAAVARFQLWYGISGDERGVYGDDTRRALESRTSRAPRRRFVRPARSGGRRDRDAGAHSRPRARHGARISVPGRAPTGPR
ncbi:peptidoglycan-binding domain-containing protein [Streptomyces lasalocidi]